MNDDSGITKLNRFTQCKFVYDMLKEKVIKVPTPGNWPDKNDSKPLLDYCKALGHEKIYALCFTHSAETVYHWYMNKDLQNTCCVEFNHDKLYGSFKDAGFKGKKVEYYKLNQESPVDDNFKSIDFKLKDEKDGPYLKDIKFEEIPYAKRMPYTIENEYRFVKGVKDRDTELFEVPIDLNCINRITVADPWWHAQFKELIDDLTKELNHEIKLNESTLERNDVWLEYMLKLTNNM